MVDVGHKGKGTTALVLMDNRQTPLAVVIAPASQQESQHMERLVDAMVVELPRKNIPLVTTKPPTAPRCVGG